MSDVFRPSQVAELLGDLLHERNIGRRAIRVIKLGQEHGVGIRRDKGNGKWEFTKNDVDILTRKLEEEAPYIYSVKDAEALIGKSYGTIISQARTLELGRIVGNRLMLKPEEVEQIAAYSGRDRVGFPLRQQYAVEDDVMTVTKIAELLQDRFPHLTLASLQDKIRRFAQEGAAGERDNEKKMWLFTEDDVEVLERAMRRGLKSLRAA